MAVFVGILGAVLLFTILWDGFEVIVLPRRVARRLRLTRLFYRSTWLLWSGLARRFAPGRRREKYLSFYGPLSLLFLLGVWAAGLILGFAMLHWAFGSQINVPQGKADFATDLYLSGTTFCTLGLGDVTPRTPAAKAVTVAEGFTGFGFLAIVIGYLPVIYQAFSSREANISLLDARAGTPSTAAELMRRHAQGHGLSALDRLLHEWERWSAEVLESHISYPVLSYYRSQHDNQSWLASLTTILDVCSLVIAGIDSVPPWQARLTFAMARHAVVDLAQILNTPPAAPDSDRLPPESLARLREILISAGLTLRDESSFEKKLAELRRMYEPYVYALSGHLLVAMPSWMRRSDTNDNWRTSAWERSSSGLLPSPFEPGEEEHFG